MQRFHREIARAKQPTVGKINMLRSALVRVLDPPDEWGELGGIERAAAREFLVEFFDLLARRDPARARALLKLWLEEAGTAQAERMRAQFPDPGDCPRCGERLGENIDTDVTERWCPYCGYTDATETYYPQRDPDRWHDEPERKPWWAY